MPPPQQAPAPQGGAATSADEALNVSAAFRALVNRCIRHLLSLLKSTGAFIAKIFVSRQEKFPSFSF
jgi:hypothetical protein